MNFKSKLKTLSFVFLALIFCAAKGTRSIEGAQYTLTGSQPSDLAALKAELSKYRTWTLVNPQPVMLESALAALCSAPNISAGDPHAKKYISVFVNEIGRSAMMSDKYPKFPRGSIIVKAKSTGGAGAVPELVTIMVKRAEGFDGPNGDWEYLVMNGDGSRVEKPADAQSCQRCHFVHKRTDYVSRAYLPDDAREKLK